MFEILCLTGLVWLAYIGVYRCGFVSDDIEGLVKYEGKLRAYNYAHLSKWLAYKILGKDPLRNHLASVVIHNANVVLLYLLLIRFMPMQVAFFASLLFAVHPLTAQSVAWISGRGYALGLFFCLLSYHTVILLQPTDIIGFNSIKMGAVFVLFAILHHLAINAQFAAISTPFILMLMGYWFPAIIGLVVSGVNGLNIVQSVIKGRSAHFEEQNLGRSTKLNLKKHVVMLKTLFYYTYLTLFPKRMGLYHKFFYHYDDKTEQDDKYSWAGFGVILGLIALFIWGNMAVKLGVLWYLAYVVIFLNSITIHQFVSERYLYFSIIGITILLATVLVNYPLALMFILGVAIMRLWEYIPAFYDEICYYQNNIWNFPDSEVAFGNMGVTYLQLGCIGSAVDMWLVALNIRPDYDVAHYNLCSIFRNKGDLDKALFHLKKAIESPISHFKKTWSDELVKLEHEIKYRDTYNTLRVELGKVIQDPAKKEEAIRINKQLDELNQLHIKIEQERKDKLNFVVMEQNNLKAKIIELDKIKEDLSKNMGLEEVVKIRDSHFGMIMQKASTILNADTANRVQS